uniref:E3 ubiquitin-protein ligase TRIM32 n=1 Tax=Oryzias sinensis TaxID=183150 RepID=A0A8C7YH71_9TELE
MLMRPHSERRVLPGFSALLSSRFSKQWNTTSSPSLSSLPQKSLYTLPAPASPTTWVQQALVNLEQGEQELQSLKERQQAEVEEVNRELDNAMIEAQREERRLLTKIEQDHREAQRHLSQVKRENSAAVRVVQSLLDQQLRKIGQIREQIQRWGSTAGEANKHQLQKGVIEVTQPWEISLTLKRVIFTPTSQSKTINFGEVEVREQSMAYPVGVCGFEGQKCPLHSGDRALSNVIPLEIRKEPKQARGGKRCSIEENTGKVCVVYKNNLSSSTENNEERNSSKSPSSRSYGVSESSQDEDAGSDLFVDIPPISSQGESEGDESDGRQSKTRRRITMKGKRRQKALVSCEESSYSPKETMDKSRDSSMSPKATRKSLLSKQSLSKRHLALSEQCLLRKKNSNESSVDSESPSSPIESEDSYSTYTVSTPINGSLKQERSFSTTDLSSKLRPLINETRTECRKVRKVNRLRLTSEPSTFEQRDRNKVESDKEFADSIKGPSVTQTSAAQSLSQKHVSRSQSMSALECDELHQSKEQDRNKYDSETIWPDLKNTKEEGGSTALGSAHLVKQFGKQGSGRTDFNLPSGVHATVRGQLFVVDCGNARIQVTDLNKNVVQQVSPSGSERSSRICNYFDVAVNSKGLIALTCAAERALLVFNRHGRFLQTFGGTAIGSTNEGLDAPRGVTVTSQDDFLVADIKRGTLTVLKLDPKTGARLERTVVTGYHRPYLVAACLTTGLMAISERGNESGRVPCIRVLEPGWNTIQILGVCSGMGPVLTCPWGLCIDSDGDVLVADWGKQRHCVFIYPSKGVGWSLVSENLNNPRGLALLPDGHVVVSDSMNHCIKIYRYK